MQFAFCPKCGAKQNELNSDNPACPSCGIFLNKIVPTVQSSAPVLEQQEEVELPRGRFHNVALLLLKIIIAGIALRYVGMHHFVNGSNIKMQVLDKKSFGFDETFINVDALSEVPMAKLKSDYPLSKIALQGAGIFKTDAQIQEEINAELKRKMNDAMDNYNTELKRKNDEAMGILNKIQNDMPTPSSQ